MTLKANSPEDAAPVQAQQQTADLETLNSYGLMLNVEETAELLRVSKATVRTYIKSGDIPAFRVGRAFRVPRHALAKYCKLDETEL